MNKKSLILAASALAMVLSCNVREESLPLPRRVTFQAVQGDNPSTRTALQSDGSVFWTPGDAINLFYGEAISAKMVFDSTATGAVAQASFTGMLPEGFYPDGKDEFWAVYPYDKDNVFDGSSVTLTLPDLQPALAGTFADDLFISLARSTGYELSFYNLCGGIKFSVNTPGITRVSFFGHQEEVLAGKVKVGFDENGKPLVQEIVEGSQSIQLDAPSGGFEVGKWYYMVALPTTLAMGYTMSFFQDGDLVSERSVETPVAIKRSIWGKLTDADAVNSEESSEVYNLITGGAEAVDGKTWVFDRYTLGHFGVGPISSAPEGNGPSWWQCSPNEKDDTSLYKNEFTFVYEGGRLLWTNQGYIYTSEKGMEDMGIQGVPCESGDYDVPYVPSENLSFTLDESNMILTLSEGAFLGYYTGTSEYYIMTVSEHVLWVWCGCKYSPDYAYYFRFVPKDELQEPGPSGISASKYLTFSSRGTTTLSLTNEGGNAPVLYYSTDAQNWTQWDYSELTFTADTPLYICGDNPSRFSVSTTQYSYFTTSGDLFAVSGSIMSLLNKDEELLTIPSDYYCFKSLFQDCTNLTSPPELPATTLGMGCYSNMFFGCTSLTVPPVLPATKMASSCYYQLLRNCTSLTVAPELPATELASGCYTQMFYGCTGLTVAPELPALSLANNCYSNMFRDCTGLITAPALPATELMEDCYFCMFWGCTSLTTAPELQATTLAKECYNRMFINCSKLEYVKCLATDISAEDCTLYWLSGASSTGIFVKSAQMNDWPSGSSGIPEGWTVENDGEEQAVTASKYLTFTSNGTTTISLSNEGGNAPVLYYSTDAQNWTQWDYSELTFTADAPLYICGDNPQGFNISNTYYSHFSATGDVFSVTGDIMSLLDKETDVLTIPNDYCFFQLFYGCTYLVSGPSLTATTLTEACYKGLFSSCYNLESAPALPATTLAPNCYEDLFYACESLTVAPELPATTMVTSCYADMLHGCSHISAAPSLPATTLAEGCYSQMFFGCSSLTEAPALPVTTLAPYCYYGMFNGTGISTAPELPAISLQPHCYEMMFVGCHSLVNAPALPATSLAEACYESMFYSCSALTTAPELPADVLVDYCYNAMFWACGNLSFVKCLATDLSAEACTSGWLSDVSGQGTFIKAANTQWSEGISGIPEGWTVKDDGPVSVADVYDIPDGWSVSLENVLVYAVGSRSFVVGDDAAENFINVYYGDDMPFGVQAGDRVSVSAEKITFMGMSEINNIETVEILSSNNSLPYVTYSPEVGQYDRVTPVRASGLVFQRSNSVYTFNYLLAMEEDADNASVDIQYPPMYLYWPDLQYFDYNDQYVDVEGFWLYRNEAESNNNGLHNILIANVYNTNTPYVDASVQEVLEGYDGMYYKVTATVSQIADTDYGNLYLTDNSSDSQLYIYGLFNLNGLYPKDAAGGWDGFSIAENSVITILGKRSTYNNTIELEKATLIRVSN